MKSVLYIKRNQYLITEENSRLNFFRFYQDERKAKIREIVENSALGSILTEDFKNIVTNETTISSFNDFQKLFEFAAIVDKKWTKKRIIVTFKRGEFDSEIINAFNEWSKYTDLEFYIPFDNSTADIRISFEENSGHWSYIGREAEHHSLKGKPTINFDPTDLKRKDESSRMGIFLHEIGHAIGLIHEHQKENSPIVWNNKKVYDDCKNWYGWDSNMVDHNIFNSYNSNELFYSKEFDVNSVMIYAIPSGWSTNYLINNTNNTLSEIDKSFVKAFYSF